MKIKPGIYVGSLCSLMIRDDEFGGQISIVVNDEQLELMEFYRNYDFNFDKDGEKTGSGCGTSAWWKNQGEIVYKNQEREDEDLLEENVIKRQKDSQ